MGWSEEQDGEKQLEGWYAAWLAENPYLLHGSVTQRKKKQENIGKVSFKAVQRIELHLS